MAIRTLFVCLVLSTAPCMWSGCASTRPSQPEPKTVKPPAAAARCDEEDEERWIHIEEPDLGPEGAKYASHGRVLMVKRIQTISNDLIVKIEIMRTQPSADVGELVEAHLYVSNGTPNAFYRIDVEPTHETVKIYPVRSFVVRGREKARTKFTSMSSGEGGIRVTCRRIVKPAKEDPQQHSQAGELR